MVRLTAFAKAAAAAVTEGDDADEAGCAPVVITRRRREGL